MRTGNRIICLLIFLSTLASVGGARALDVVILMEQQLRDLVRVEILPKYPAAALKEKVQGVVVSQLEFDAEGVVTSVEIIESPSSHFGRSTVTALKEWRFDPIVTPKGQVLGGRGKLTFYFYYKDGRGWSENPLIFMKSKKPNKA